jgi:hypothetical protein
MDPADRYEYPPMASIVCPKCGRMTSIEITTTSSRGLTYAGVCSADLGAGPRCDAMLTAQVTAHLAPAAK